MANDIIDINVYETVETVAITVNPNLTTVNINKVTSSGGGGVTNLSTTQTASNFTINSDTGDDALVPLGNGTLAGATLNNYTTAEKNKLAGIATGAEVNVNADWNAISGDALILNKPTIPSVTNLVPYTGANQNVNLGINTITASSLIKQGGTSAQLLAANGDVITAGTNITISGGTISSTGGAGGSSSVSFYLNGSIASNVAGYQQIGATAVIGTGTDFSLVGNGTIAQFLTDVGSPNRLEIPSGAWNFELWLQSSINNSGTNVHIELYKYDGAFTLIATGGLNPINLQTNTTTNLYVTNVAIPQTTLLATDRLAIRVIASNAVGLHSVTLHTEDSNICEVITNFVGGVTAINGITQPSQTLATGTTGTDFTINSSGSTHTFNLPSASATARGVVTTSSQTFAGDKTFTGAIGASNLSGTNTGDETITTIKTKLGITTLSGSNTGDQNLSGYAPLASPAFTGTPSLPTGTIGVTQTAGDNSTKIATTAFVSTAVAAGGVTVSGQDTFGTANIATVTAAQYAGFVTAGTVSSTTLYFITA